MESHERQIGHLSKSYARSLCCNPMEGCGVLQHETGDLLW